MADLLRRLRHRVQPAARDGCHTAALQLGGLYQPAGRGQLRQEVQLQGSDHDLQHDDGGHFQAPDRVRSRSTSSSRQSTCSANSSRASSSSRSTTPTSRTSRRHGRNSRTRSTTRVGSTPSLTRSTRPGIAWRNDHVSGSPTDLANPWAFPWQGAVQGKGRRTGRLPREPEPRTHVQRRVRPQHDIHCADQRGEAEPRELEDRSPT